MLSVFSAPVHLESLAERYIDQALAETSKIQYARVLQKLTLFCKQQGYQDKLTFSPQVIELFITKLASEGASVGSVQSALSAIRYYCRKNGLVIEFDSVRLKLLLRGIERSMTGKGRRTTHVSMSMLKRLIAVTSSVASIDEAVRLRACFTLAFFGLLRPSELSRTPTTPGHQLRRGQLKLMKSKLTLTFSSYKAMASSAPVTVQP